MPKEIGIAVIHGMGSQKKDYSEPMRKEIDKRIGNAKSSKVIWEEIYWADILESRQKEYLKRANSKNDLDYITLRKFMISSFGDASGYRKTGDPNNNTYERIHGRVKDGIKKLDDQLGGPKPLIILAHSLGGHVMSNYIYDMQKPNSPVAVGLNDFQKMKTLTGIITFGCNIPFYTFAFDKINIKPIKFPGQKLTPDQKTKAKWLNFYDPDDVLGYPLKAINKAYSDVVNQDIPINVGGILSSWNPMSHTKYWTDNDFTKPVSRFISMFL
jgi:hypothetical protein